MGINRHRGERCERHRKVKRGGREKQWRKKVGKERVEGKWGKETGEGKAGERES